LILLKYPSEPLQYHQPGFETSEKKTMQNDPSGDILSCVVYTHPGRGPEVAAAIHTKPGAEVIAGIPESKLVITIEDTGSSRAADVLGELNAVPGVINTLLIYHCGPQSANASTQLPQRPVGTAAHLP
jgi:nitrate reductase NapAB chaperone NapD